MNYEIQYREKGGAFEDTEIEARDLEAALELFKRTHLGSYESIVSISEY
tara:strand:- start:1434 stop:1580 length:147 start_codon:yes stop_codon:yes gene_type:complete